MVGLLVIDCLLVLDCVLVVPYGCLCFWVVLPWFSVGFTAWFTAGVCVVGLVFLVAV